MPPKPWFGVIMSILYLNYQPITESHSGFFTTNSLEKLLQSIHAYCSAEQV
jgi:hypothetical protein